MQMEEQMHTLIIFDSNFGNTERVAKAMAAKLEEHGTVKLSRAADASIPEMHDADLLIIGGPTQRQGLSPAIQALLENLPRKSLKGWAAAFDTRYHMSAWKSGSAAASISRRIKRAGALLAFPPESFFVTDREGPLEEGELDRAVHWVQALYKQVEKIKSPERVRVGFR